MNGANDALTALTLDGTDERFCNHKHRITLCLFKGVALEGFLQNLMPKSKGFIKHLEQH